MSDVKYYTRRVTAIRNELIYFFDRCVKKQFEKEYIEKRICEIKRQFDYSRLRRVDHEYIRGLQEGLEQAHKLRLDHMHIRYLCRDGHFRLRDSTDQDSGSYAVRIGDDQGPLIYLFSYPTPTEQSSTLYNLFSLPERTKQYLRALNVTHIVSSYNIGSVGGPSSYSTNYVIGVPFVSCEPIIDAIVPSLTVEELSASTNSETK